MHKAVGILEDILQDRLASLGAADIASVACSCAQLSKQRNKRLRLCQTLFDPIADRAAELAARGCLDAHEACRLLWAYATAQKGASEICTTLDPVLTAGVQTGTLTGKELSLIVWSYSRVGGKEHRVFTAVEMQIHNLSKLGTLQHDLSPRDVAMVAWAFATRNIESPMLYSAIAGQIAIYAPQFNAQDLANVLWSFSRLAPSTLQATVFASLEEPVLLGLKRFSAQGVSTVLMAFAKSGQGTSTLWHHFEEEVTCRKRLGLRELSTIAYAFAKAGKGSQALFRQLGNAIVCHPGRLRAEDLQTALWAFATAQPTDCSYLVEALSPQLVDSACDLGPRGTPTVVWALSRMEGENHGLIEMLLRQSSALAPQLSLQGISMTLQAAKSAGVETSPSRRMLLESLDARVMSLSRDELHGNPVAIAGTLCGFAQLSYTKPSLFSCLAAAACCMAGGMTAQSLSNTLWAAASAGCWTPYLYETLEPYVIASSKELAPEGLSQCLWAYATAGHRSPRAFECLGQEILQRAGECGSMELAQVAWAFATAGEDGLPIITAINGLFESGKVQKPVQPSAVAMMLWAAAELTRGDDIPKAIVAAAADELEANCGAFGTQELAISARSLAAMGCRCSKAFKAIEMRAQELSQELIPQDISNLLWAFAKLQHRSPGLFYTMEPIVANEAANFTAQGLANCIWAFGAAGHIPSSEALVDSTTRQICARAAEFKPKEARMTLLGYSRMMRDVPSVISAFEHIIKPL